jgi:nucleotidyltransferase/DNA polymerase involved in DNA repair
LDYKIEDIEGIGPAYAEKLAAADIKTTGGLLGQCCSRGGRKQMAEKTGVSEKLLLKWSNMADMMRISGIGPQYAEMLEAAGVDTVKELATRRGDNLTTKMKEVNEAKNLANATPAESVVTAWIDAAKGTEPKMTY